MRTVIIRDVPESEVAETVADLESAGAKVFKPIKQTNQKYMIIAQLAETAEPAPPAAAETAAIPLLATSSATSATAAANAAAQPNAAADFVAFCRTFLGKPYVWGADGPDTYDCSGLVQALLARIGLDPAGDQTANALYRWFSQTAKGRRIVGAPTLGCLVFYGTPRRVGHIGLCLDATTMIEAGGGGPETTSVEIARQQNAMVRESRIDRRRDLVAVIKPSGLPW